jgi:16S rRNA (guanine527-N7)-methyltransferase
VSWSCLAEPTHPPEEVAGPARRVFGARMPLAARYAHLLATDAVDWGLLGPHEVDRVWARHLLNCAVVGELVPSGALVVDVGSGAGLPGVPLAIARPDLRLVLLEPMARRVDFLRRAVTDLELTSSITVVRGRAESSPGLAAPVVVARAVAPLERLARWCLPLLRPGGALLALRGERAERELADAAAALAALRLSAELVTCGAGLPEPTRVVRLRRTGGPRGRRPADGGRR